MELQSVDKVAEQERNRSVVNTRITYLYSVWLIYLPKQWMLKIWLTCMHAKVSQFYQKPVQWLFIFYASCIWFAYLYVILQGWRRKKPFFCMVLHALLSSYGVTLRCIYPENVIEWNLVIIIILVHIASLCLSLNKLCILVSFAAIKIGHCKTNFLQCIRRSTIFHGLKGKSI